MSLEKFNESQSSDLNLTEGLSLLAEKKAILDNQDLQCLQQLRKAKWFKAYYERRLVEEREACIREMLTEVPHDKVIGLRATISFIDKLLKMPDNDRLIKWRALNPNQPLPED